MFFFFISLDNRERETSLGRGGGGGERGWSGEMGVKIQRRQSKKNVNTMAEMRTKDTKHATFLSSTLLSLSLSEHFSGILGLWSVT